MATLPYSGGSRSNIRLPHEEEPTPEPVEDDEPTEDGTEPTASPPREFDRGRYSRSRASVSQARPVKVSEDLTGFALALLVWGWVVLPFLGTPLSPKGGVQGVKDVWRAKFLNKGPDGKWLP